MNIFTMTYPVANSRVHEGTVQFNELKQLVEVDDGKSLCVRCSFCY